jgi:uncharacterized protein YaaR (DUF327 family)
MDIKCKVSENFLIDSMELGSSGINKIISKLKKQHYIEMSEGLWQLTAHAKNAVNVYRREKIKALSQEKREMLKKASSKMDDIGFYLKYTVARYQLKADGLKRIMDSLEETHEQLKEILRDLAKFLPHFKHYVKRLENTFSKIKKNTSFIVNHPNSYYNIYCELSTDLKNFITECKNV